jgi:enamine deaminase RidA (YjgF/YER057c/UK114 family)
MDKPQFFITPGFGERFHETMHFATALKIGNRIETSGLGGWSNDLVIPADVVDEIRLAFKNIERTLAEAGATWADVVHVNSYHVGGFPPKVNATIVKLYREYMPDRAPIWTQVWRP